MDTDRRMSLLRDLEAHYGRWLRHSVITAHQSAVQMATAVPDRTFGWPKLVEFDQHAYDIAIEGEAAINMARGIQDERTLDIFVRWKTLPNWRKALEDDGWSFDERDLKWSHPEHGRMY